MNRIPYEGRGNPDPFPFNGGKAAIAAWQKKENEMLAAAEGLPAPPAEPPAAPPDQAKLAAQAEREAMIKAIFQETRKLVENTVNRDLAPLLGKAQIQEQRIDKLTIGLSEAERDLTPLIDKAGSQEQKTNNLLIRMGQLERKLHDMEIRAAEKASAQQIPFMPEQSADFERIENAAMAKAGLISSDGILDGASADRAKRLNFDNLPALP
jgi:hypothetical protein